MNLTHRIAINLRTPPPPSPDRNPEPTGNPAAAAATFPPAVNHVAGSVFKVPDVRDGKRLRFDSGNNLGLCCCCCLPCNHCSIWIWIVVVILAYGDSLLGGTNQLLPHPGHEIIFTFLLHTMLYESYVCLLVFKTIFI